MSENTPEFFDELSDDEYEEENRTPEFLDDLAARRGCYVEPSDDLTLQIDLDDPEDLQVFDRTMAILAKMEPALVRGATTAPSKSGEGYHVRVRLNEPLDVRDRILLQACLGSDVKREMISWCRVRKNIPLPVVLFRPSERLLCTKDRLLGNDGALCKSTRNSNVTWKEFCEGPT